jgi:hypothetical protein
LKIVHIMNWFIPGMGYQENFLPLNQAKLGNSVTIICGSEVPPYYSKEEMKKFRTDHKNERCSLSNNLELIRLPSINVHNQINFIGPKEKFREMILTPHRLRDGFYKARYRSPSYMGNWYF